MRLVRRAASAVTLASLATVAAAAVGGAVAALWLAGTTASPSRAAQAVPFDWAGATFTGIHGEPVAGDTFAGRAVLLVNTASRCAFTPQYEALEALWDAHRGGGLTVLGVPSNDFGNQEPGSNADIANFCASTYDVSFPMLQKAKVTGADAHPLFAWAQSAGGRAAVPAWNFHKVLIGRDGRFLAAFPSYVKPDAPQVREAVARALATPAL